MAEICEFTVLFIPVIKLVFEEILKLVVIVEFQLFIKFVLEEILLKLDVIVEFKLFIK